MAADTDYLLDRRLLKRKVGFWRIAAFAVAALAVLHDRPGTRGTRPDHRREHGGAHVAKVDISGFITGDDKTIDLLKRVGKSNASAVLVMINSPGGTVTGSETL